MPDIVTNCLEREASVDQSLHAGMPQRVRPGTGLPHSSLVQVVVGTPRDREVTEE
jgi:hypothetical protein